MPAHCVLYARVSTEEQAEKFGLSTQLYELREYAKRKGYLTRPDWEFIDDGYSGADLGRPALTRLRDLARLGQVGVVLVYDPDRLARKLAHQIILAEELEQLRVRLEFITTPTEDTPEGRMFFNLKGIFAEYEKEKIRERTLRGRRQKARQGFIVGGRTPYGYRYLGKAEGEGGRYVVKEEEARVVRLIYEWLVNDGLSIRGIVSRLNELGFRPQRGMRWGKSSVHRILDNPAYTGKTYYNRRERTYPQKPRTQDPHRRNKKTALRARPATEWIAISVPAIVDAALFNLAARQLQRNAEILSGRNTHNFYLLRGLLRCKVCGRKFMGLPSHGKRYYRCQGRDRLFEPDRCRVGLLHADSIERFIWETVVRVLENPALLRDKLARHHHALRAESADVESEGVRLEQSLAEVQRQEARMLDAYLDETLHLPLLKKKLNELAERRISLTSTLESTKARLARKQAEDSKEQTIARYCRLAVRGIRKLSSERQQRLLRAVIDEIVVQGCNVEIRGILPGRWVPSESEKRKAGIVEEMVANRPHHQDVMPARGCHLESALGMELSLNILKIDRVAHRLSEKGVCVNLNRLERLSLVHQVDHIRQTFHSIHRNPANHSGLPGIG
jgi:site-specific DNA recombinase